MYRSIAILLVIGLAFAGPLRAQDLQLHVAANKTVAGQNHSVTYSMVVGNTGAEALSDVEVTWIRPADVSMPDILIGDMFCPAFERCEWTVGTLQPGQSRTGILTVMTDDDAAERTLRANVTASASNAETVTAGADVLIDATPLIRLSVAPQAGPVVPGEPFTYTLTYGNGGTENVADATLRFIVPEGTSLLSATHDGSFQDGVVTWTTGPLGTGTGGERRVTVRPDASLADGSSIVARGEIDPGFGGEPVVGSDAVTPVRSGVPLAVDVAASQSVLLAGDLLFVTVTAANTGQARLDDVAVRFRRPGGTVSAYENFGPITQCFTNAHCEWEFGTLEPGESASNTLVFRMSTSQTEGVVTRMPIAATAAGIGEVFLKQDFLVEASPLLRLSIAPQKTADGALTYRITYGNVGTTNLTSPSLRFDVPRGTSVTAVTGGGRQEGDTVVWELGALPAFGGGSVDVTVRPDADLADGELISAGAYIDPGISRAGVRSSSVVALEASAPLDVTMALDRSFAAARGVFTATLVATNRGTAALSDASVIFHGIGQYVSSVHELTDDVSCGLVHCVWSVGHLDPGESRFASVMMSLSPLIPSGEILRIPVIVGETGRVAMQSDLLLDTTPLLRLSLNTISGQTAPGHTLEYTLSYSNVGTRNVEQAELRLPVPGGTQFVSASGDGMLMNGAVVWNLGSLGIGGVGQATAIFRVDGALANGDVIVADASLDSGIATEAVVRSTAAAAVRTDTPIHLDLAVDRSPVVPRGPLTMILTAANPGPFELNNVAVRMRKPGLDMLDLTVGLNLDCTSGGDCSWVLDGLGPGESMTAHVSIAVDSDVDPGEILHADVLAQGDGIDDVYLRRDVIVEASPIAHLSLAPGDTPTAVGEPLNVVLTFGNAGSDPLNDVVLQVPLPDGSSFASANLGGVERDGFVAWEFGEIEAGAGGQVHLSVIPDAGLAEGSILSFEAELDTKVSGRAPLHSSGASAIGADVPFEVEIETTAPDVLPAESVTFELTAVNSGAFDLANSGVVFRLSAGVDVVATGEGLACNTEACAWEFGTLPAGDSRSTSATLEIDENAAMGQVFRTAFVGLGTGTNMVTLRRDVLIGTMINFPPDPVVIAEPADGSVLVVGGAAGEDPLPAETPFVVSWPEPSDPEGDALSYTWQLATSTAFDDPLISLPSSSAGASVRFETTFGALAAVLVAEGFAVGEERTVYHRVVTSDGINVVDGAPASLRLVRGTVVGTEHASDVPSEFALHGNYPNPFNPSTTFRFDLPTPARVTLTIYDATGRKVADVLSSAFPAGSHEYAWSMDGHPSGVYFYRLEADGFSGSGRLVLLR